MEGLQGLRSERLNKIRSWKSEFFNREQFSLPDGWSTAQNRLSSNVGYFQSNYLIVFLLLLAYCLISHFFLAIILVGVFGGYVYVNSLPPDYSIQMGGMLITKKTLIVTLIVVAILMLLFTGVGSAFFWLIGISGLIVGTHAATHEVSIETDFGQQA